MSQASFDRRYLCDERAQASERPPNASPTRILKQPNHQACLLKPKANPLTIMAEFARGHQAVIERSLLFSRFPWRARVSPNGAGPQ